MKWNSCRLIRLLLFITYRKAKWPAYIYEKAYVSGYSGTKRQYACLHFRRPIFACRLPRRCHFSNSKSSVALKKVAGHRISSDEKQSAILQGFTEILGCIIQSIHLMILNRYWLPTTIKLYSHLKSYFLS